jgi:ribosome assembly protein YihI (activator of Der GTPase)
MPTKFSYKIKKRKRNYRKKTRRHHHAGSRKSIVDRIQLNKIFVSLDPNYGLTNPFPVKNPHDD